MKAPQDSTLISINDKAEMIEEPERAAKHLSYVFLAVLALSAMIFFFGLGRLALVGPDEPRYAEVAREMFATGDYISTRLCGCLWFEKPALLYWMAALSYQLLGVSELAARIPSAVAALASVAFIYFALRRVISYKAAIASSTVLATSGIFIAYARVATPDIALAAAMSVALICGFLATQASRRSSLRLWIVSFGAMGLAMLAKGLVGILLTVVILAFYALLTRRWGAIGWKEVIIGSLAFLLVASTWYVPVTAKHGWQFIEEFF